jgi:hypothetical protein
MHTGMSFWNSASGLFNATCNWLNNTAACNTHVIVQDSTPTDTNDTTVLTVASSETMRSLTLRAGVKLLIKSGGRVIISHNDGECNDESCSSTSTTPFNDITTKPGDGATNGNGGGGGGGDASTTPINRAATTTPSATASGSSSSSPIIPIVAVVVVLLLLAALLVVLRRRQQKDKTPNDPNSIMFTNGAFVGEVGRVLACIPLNLPTSRLVCCQNGRPGFEAFEVDVRNSMSQPSNPVAAPTAWDEADYAITDKNDPNYATMAKGGGVFMALHLIVGGLSLVGCSV